MDDEIKLPFRLSDVLSGAYYTLSITGVVIGLVAWTVHQQARIDYLEMREKEHPTKSELAETAIRIDNRITGLERNQESPSNRADAINIRVDQRLQDLTKEQGVQGQKVSIIEERQNRVIRDLQALNERVDRVVQALDSTYSRLNEFIDSYNRAKGGGEHGPTSPSWNAPQKR